MLYFYNSCPCLFALVDEIKFIYLFTYFKIKLAKTRVPLIFNNIIKQLISILNNTDVCATVELMSFFKRTAKVSLSNLRIVQLLIRNAVPCSAARSIEVHLYFPRKSRIHDES